MAVYLRLKGLCRLPANAGLSEHQEIILVIFAKPFLRGWRNHLPIHFADGRFGHHAVAHLIAGDAYFDRNIEEQNFQCATVAFARELRTVCAPTRSDEWHST